MQIAAIRGALWLEALFNAISCALDVVLGIWGTRVFWWQNRIHLIPVAFGVLFWWRVIVGVASGTSPLLGWMVCAYVSVWITTVVVSQIMAGLKAAKRNGPAMLLLQLGVVIVANTFVILQMIAQGNYFRSDDRLIVGSAMLGLGLVMFVLLVRGKSFASDWALCGYSVALKSTPQGVQAWAIHKGAAKLDPLSGAFLFCQGLSRLVISFKMWRDGKCAKTRAQLTNASFDQFTITAIVVAVVASY